MTKEWNACPVRYAAAEFADRWVLIILRDILLLGRRRFGEMLGAGEGIATNILTDRLARLEASQILESRRDPTNGRRKIYLPTQKGKDLIPVLLSVMEWAWQWDEATDVPKDFIDRYRADPAGFAAEIRATVEQTDQALIGG